MALQSIMKANGTDKEHITFEIAGRLTLEAVFGPYGNNLVDVDQQGNSFGHDG